MQVWDVLHAARWKYRTQKLRKSRHLRTIAQLCRAMSSHLRHVGYQQYLFHMSSHYGEHRPTDGWDRLTSLGHPTKFQRVSRLGFATALTSLNGGQPNFAWCLVVSWAGTLCSKKNWTNKLMAVTLSNLNVLLPYLVKYVVKKSSYSRTAWTNYHARKIQPLKIVVEKYSPNAVSIM